MSHVTPQHTTDASEAIAAKPDGTLERSVEVLIFLFYKAFSAMRMYARNHPAIHEVLQQLYKSIDEFFEDEDVLRIDLTESEMIFNGCSVYREEEKRGSLIFMLFNDGIREIQFERGLTHEEILQFLEALKVNSGLPQDERDIVSLFWSKSFDHIRYFAVDEIPDQEIECVDKALVEMESRGLTLDSAGESNDDDRTEFRSQQLEVDIRAEERSSHSRMIAQLKSYNQEEIESLLEAVRRGRCFEPKLEFIRLVFDIFYLEDEEQRYLPVLKLLETYADELLTRCAFEPVHHIMNNLKAFLENERSQYHPLRQHIEALLRKYSTEEKICLLRRGLKGQFSFEPEDLCEFVRLLHPTAIGPVCSLLGEIEDQNVRKTLCEGLEVLAKGQTSRLTQPLRAASVSVAKDIIAVLGKIRDERAVELLRTCVHHSHTTVREEAIKALRTFGTPQAQEALMEFLMDEDPAVRIGAAEGLAAFDPCCHIRPIFDIVQKKTFGKRSFREKKALLSVLGKIGSQEGIHILEALLSKRGLFYRKRQDETRICAALALGNVHSGTARNILERFSRDSSSAVREACIQALRTTGSQH